MAIIASTIGLSAPSLEAASILYGVTQDDKLLTIDPATGAGILIGSLGLPSGIAPLGLAARGSAFYIYDTIGNRIRQVDPATAAILDSINISLPDAIIGEGDVAFRADGIGYLASNLFTGGSQKTALYSFDVAVPGSSTIKPLTTANGSTNPQVDGLAFSADGVLYAFQSGGTTLFTLDQATGVATSVGATGIPFVAFLGGLTFDPSGKLYAVMGANSASNLYRFDLASGATATLVGPVTIGGNPVGKLDGIAFLTSREEVTAVPEPASLLLLATGIAEVARRQALRNRRPAARPRSIV